IRDYLDKLIVNATERFSQHSKTHINLRFINCYIKTRESNLKSGLSSLCCPINYYEFFETHR
ncbi:hypothetical protein WL514_13155, partial [Staphylococcus saprophyticus]